MKFPTIHFIGPIAILNMDENSKKRYPYSEFPYFMFPMRGWTGNNYEVVQYWSIDHAEPLYPYKTAPKLEPETMIIYGELDNPRADPPTLVIRYK